MRRNQKAKGSQTTRKKNFNLKKFNEENERRIKTLEPKTTKYKRISKNTAYKKGRTFEYRVVNYYRKQGYWAKRSYGSKGPFDVMAIKAIDYDNFPYVSSVLLIQCKNLSVERKLSKEAKENLKKVAKQMGATPLHIFNRNHKLVIEEIT